MKRFLVKYPIDTSKKDRIRVPVLAATIPAPATIKNLATRLLGRSAIRSPAARRHLEFVEGE